MKKMNKYLGFLISIVPFNFLRIFLYRKIFGYHIHKSYIGWRTIIVVQDAEIIESKIGSNNFFHGPMKIVIKKDAWIKQNNKFQCGKWTNTKEYESDLYLRYFELGENSIISKNHYFDIAGSLIIGNNSWIAGRGSQFWTHGAGVTDRNIVIGNYCYVGSAVRFAPGACIGNNNIVALGSVLTRKYNNQNVLLGGQPAKILKENYDWRSRRYLESDITPSMQLQYQN